MTLTREDRSTIDAVTNALGELVGGKADIDNLMSFIMANVDDAKKESELIESLEAQLDEKTGFIIANREEIGQLRTALETDSDELEQYKTHAKMQARRIKQLEQNYEHCKSEVIAIRKRVNRKINLLEQKQLELDEANGVITAMGERIDQLSMAASASATTKSEHHHRDIAHLQTRNEMLTKEVDRLNARLRCEMERDLAHPKSVPHAYQGNLRS